MISAPRTLLYNHLRDEALALKVHRQGALPRILLDAAQRLGENSLRPLACRLGHPLGRRSVLRSAAQQDKSTQSKTK